MLRRGGSRWIVTLALMHAGSAATAAPASPPDVLTQWVERVQFRMVQTSPDAARVAVLTSQASARDDSFELVAAVVPTPTTVGEPAPPVPRILHRFRLQADALDFGGSGSWPTIMQAHWSPDGQALLYTLHREGRAELWHWRAGSDIPGQQILAVHGRLRLTTTAVAGPAVGIEVYESGPSESQRAGLPDDRAMRIEDRFRFVGPWVPAVSESRRRMHFDWTRGVLQDIQAPAERVHSGLSALPTEMANPLVRVPYLDGAIIATYSRRTPSPDGHWAAERQLGYLRADTSRPLHITRIVLRRTVPSASNSEQDLDGDASTPREDDGATKSGLAWSADSRQYYFLSSTAQGTSVQALHLDGTLRTLYTEDAELRLPAGGLAANGSATALLRTVAPGAEELTWLEWDKAPLRTLYAPNTAFNQSIPTARSQAVALDDSFHGRLYLPDPARFPAPYPLVFTLYRSFASVGDEVPILALAQHGIAVFSLSSRGIEPRNGDHRFEVLRVRRAQEAMEQLVAMLSKQGVVDAARVGLTGLSYGSEIAMYAYAHSHAFRAISSATASLTPSWYDLLGLSDSQRFASRGFCRPDLCAQAWDDISALKGAGSHRPPLLWQAPEYESNAMVESWSALRRAGAPVEWLHYFREGHVKLRPANLWWVHQRNLDWFRFWLQDAEDPAPIKAEQYRRWREMRVSGS